MNDCPKDLKALNTECKAPKEKRKQFKRRFLGKIDNFIDKQERAVEKKHLKAYLKGDKRFIIGYSGIARIPFYSAVKQELIEVL